MLEQMCDNAITEDRFLDASFYFYQLAMDTASIHEEELGYLVRQGQSPQTLNAFQRKHQRRFDRFYHLAEVCYAYHYVLQSVREPFTDALPSVLYNMACFLVLKVVPRDTQAPPALEPPKGMSTVTILQCLAKYAEQMGAYNLARFVYNRLGSLNMPDPKHQEHNDLLSLAVRAKPFKDREALLPVCFNCGAQNPNVGSRSLGLKYNHKPGSEDVCNSCGTKFERSFATFEYLPVVEFRLGHGIDEREAIQLIKEAGMPENGGGGDAMAPHPNHFDDSGAQGGYTNENQGLGGAHHQVLSLDADMEEASHLVDQQLRDQGMVNGQGMASGAGGGGQAPPAMSRDDLRRMHASEVIVHQWPGKIHPTKFFRVLDPDAQIMLGACGHFYEQDEYEMFLLDKGCAPFCRLPMEQSSAEKMSLGYVSGMEVDGEEEGDTAVDGAMADSGLASGAGGEGDAYRGKGRGGKGRKKLETAAALVANSLENQSYKQNSQRSETQFGSVVMKRPNVNMGSIPPRPQSRGVQR